MHHINGLKDLRDYGIDPLTGEACGLGLRVLCDVTAKGKAIIVKAFGFPADFKLADAWNNGTKEDPHIGSIMLTSDMTFLLSVFALLEKGHAKVASFWRKDNNQWLSTVGGGEEETKRWAEVFAENNNVRWFSYAGTAGDRNRHEMSGRVD